MGLLHKRGELICKHTYFSNGNICPATPPTFLKNFKEIWFLIISDNISIEMSEKSPGF